MTDSTLLLEADTNFFSFHDFISGWAAGIVATCVGHPMETIRVIQQVTNTSAMKATREIYRRDKFVGYYRGMMSPILSTGVVNSVFFGINGNVMRFIQLYRNNDLNQNNIDTRFCCDAKNLNKYWHSDVFMSACVGGFFCSLINLPFEVVKTMLQASNISTLKPERLNGKNKADPSKTTSLMKLITELYKTNGIRSLYRGGTIIMIRDVPSMGVYMLSYEHVCSVLKKLTYNEPGIETKQQSMPKYIQLISGGIAGVTSWVSVLPFDVIKSKIIADSLTRRPQYKGAWDCVKKTYREGGVVRFYQGFWLVSVRAFPVNAISLMVYETVLNACSNNGTLLNL